MRKNIGFIGCGNMGSALIGGMIAKGFSAADILVADADAKKTESAVAKFGIRAVADNRELVKNADAVVLAVKPQMIAGVAAELSGSMKGKLVISIIAGKRIGYLAQALGDEALAVVRVMPNTPALVGEGMALISYAQTVGESDRTFATSIFAAVGEVMEIHESLMDAGTAISGSGPAYLFAFVEAIMSAGEENGFTAEQAKILATQTFKGAIKMIQETGEHPSVLRKNVTSPNGTTEAALKAMEAHKISDGIRAMIAAAKQRSEELSR